MSNSKKRNRKLAWIMSFIMMLSVLMPSIASITDIAQAADKTITGTCQVEMTKGIDWDNGATGISQFDVTMPNGKIYKAHCLDPGNPTPKDGTYKFTGTLNSSGTYDIVINSGKTTSNLDDIHPWDQDHIKHGGPPWVLQNIGGFTYSPITYGYIELQKSSGNTAISNGNPCYSLQGAVYGVYKSGSLVTRLTTNASGYAKSGQLEAGITYTVKEITAPKGYALDTKTYTVTVGTNTTVRVNSIDMPQNDPAGVLLQKFDSETGQSVPQGDGSLAGAEYTVKFYAGYYYSVEDLKGITPTRTWVYKTDENGYLNLRYDQPVSGKSDPLYYNSSGYPTLPYGTVTIQETKAPEGYFLNEEIYIDQITSNGSTTETVHTYNKPTDDTAQSEKVKKMKVHIFKTGTEESGQMPGLEGAEFTFKLESQVQAAYDAGYTYAEVWNGLNENGVPQEGVSADRIKAAQTIAPDMDVITTNANGDAYSKDLPYGTYIGKETKTPTDFEPSPDFRFSITEDSTEADAPYIEIRLNDKPMRSQVKMVKKDADSGKIVSFNSATFKIIAKEDIYSRGTGELLYAAGDTIKQKVGGTWYDEFTTNSENQPGTFNGENGTVFTPLEMDPGKYALVELKTPDGFLLPDGEVPFEIGNIKDYTQDADGDYFIEVVMENEQPKGEINLTKKIEADADADLNLFDENSDLSGIKFGLYAKEDIVDMADGSVVYEKDALVGEYNLNTDGTLDITDLWVGNYYLKELETLPGLILDYATYDVSITKTDDTTKVISVAQEVTNKTTRTELSKTDITGDQELPGAELSVINKETGEEVVSWTSTDKPFVIAGLPKGDYILNEKVAPEGYVLSTDSVDFTVNDNGEVAKAQMKDTYVDVVKEGPAGEVVYGAEMTVFDKETGEVVDSWTVSKEDPQHKIKNLIQDKTYIISESYAPEGYVIAADIEFTVTGKDNQHFEMIDKQVAFTKVDVNGKPIAGMEYTVTSEKTKQIVDKGITTSDGAVFLNGLVYGGDYVITETGTPEGYATALPVKFTVNDKKVQTVTMVNKTVTFEKVDQFNKPVEGGLFAVLDKDGNELYQFTAKKDGVVLKDLVVNEIYYIKELKAPSGFVLNKEPVKFTVLNDDENQIVKMDNKYIVGKITMDDNPSLTGSIRVQTGDDMYLGLILIVCMSAGLCAAHIATKRRKTSKE